jgi:hypothetical protein
MLTRLEQHQVLQAARRMAEAWVRAKTVENRARQFGSASPDDARRLREKATAAFKDFLKEVGEFEEPVRPHLHIVKETRHARAVR